MGEIKPEIETFAKIKVVGVGGGGNSAVNRMIDANIQGVDFLVINTDVQALSSSKAPTKLHIGKTITRGLGAGMNPEIGRKSAEENQNDIREALKDADMVFITCGLGGGTGSGAAPIVAEIAKDLGALTIAVVTKPFSFEGAKRAEIAEEAFDALSEKIDSIIAIPNDKLLDIIDKNISLLEAFSVSDSVLQKSVQGISELITVSGLINVDFADVKAIMAEKGLSLIGIGEASGENRAVNAAKSAIQNSLLDMSIDGAQGILLNISGGANLTMHEVNEAAKTITDLADPDAKIIFGANIDESLKDTLRITVVATGFDEVSQKPFKEEKIIIEEKKEENKKKKEEKEEEKKKHNKDDIFFEDKSYDDEEEDQSQDNQDEFDIPAFLRNKIKR